MAFQTANIKGHFVMDNIVCAHKILHQVKLSKTKRVLFKIDFEKFLIELIGFF
jgi:hypothetical protein